MKNASSAFVNARPADLSELTGGLPIPLALQTVAGTFVQLQQARYEADYNVARRFTRAEAEELVRRARQAFDDWQTIRTNGAAQMYLGALLVWKTWRR